MSCNYFDLEPQLVGLLVCWMESQPRLPSESCGRVGPYPHLTELQIINNAAKAISGGAGLA